MSDSRIQRITASRCVRGDPIALWGLLADTNRVDRLLGIFPGNYGWRTAASGERERFGTATRFGFDAEWVEPPYEWVEGEFVQGCRRYAIGPLEEGGFRAEVARDSDGYRITATVYACARHSPVGWLISAASSRVRRILEDYLDEIAGLSERARVSSHPLRAAWDCVFEHGSEKMRGPTSGLVRDEFAFRTARLLADARAPLPALTAVVRHLETAADDDVETMRPYVLAERWSLERADVLRAFLAATRAGLVDLQWSLDCPACRVRAASAPRLGEVRARVHCEACGIDYDTDFASRVEAVFVPNAAVRDSPMRIYCASSPSFQPHVLAQITVSEDRLLSLPWPGEPVDVRVLGLPSVFRVTGETLPARATLRVSGHDTGWALDEAEGQLSASPQGSLSDSGTLELRIEQKGGMPRTVRVERVSRPWPPVLGSEILLVPEYMDLFAADAPAQGVEVAIGDVAVLFTDLTGSTALYERVGDARAFAAIEGHFRALDSHARAHGGTTVKTMGDAVMAVFPSTCSAVRAGLAMIQSVAAEFSHERVALKVGVHAGPCIAVRANDRLDFFGVTVNLAARLQCQAAAHELVVHEDALRHPEIERLLSGFAQHRFEAKLKGIGDTQKLVAIALL